MFVQALVLGCLRRGEATLTDFAQICAELGVDITPQGIDDRIQAPAVTMLSTLFQQSLRIFQNQSGIPNAVLGHFNGIHLLDRTQIALPDAMQSMFAGCGGDGAVSAVKAQLDFNYLTGTMTAVELGAGRSPDQVCDLAVRMAEVGKSPPGGFRLFHSRLFCRPGGETRVLCLALADVYGSIRPPRRP